MKKKILFVFGTRPEAIKMAPAVMELKKRTGLDVKICVTAQHRGMLDEVLSLFKIRPNYDLNIMQEGQTLEHITKQVIEKFPPVLQKEKPDLVLVHGDTSTTFLASLASFYQKVPVAHVEAGLRSYDYANPFPEEANRRLADDLCSLHFAPTEASRKNLLKENISAKGIFITGNTVIDALDWAVRQPHKFQSAELKKFMDGSPKGASLILVTAHRRENFGEPIQNICHALKEIANKYENVRIVYPVHPNPNVKSVAMEILSSHERICLLPPVNYLDLAHLIQKCSFVVTDSGGLQEEAPSLGKPVLVLRKVTERPEAVKAGTARVIGTDRKKIVSEISKLLTNPAHYRRMANAVNPYGDGKASARIADAVLFYFGLGKKPRDFRPK